MSTYERFERLIRSWVDAHVFQMLVVGPPGVGKSAMYHQVIAQVQGEYRQSYPGPDPPIVPNAHVLTGRLSAIECFRLLRDDPRSLVIFDDLAGIISDPHFTSFMLQLCETKRYRMIRWQTNAAVLRDEAKEFVCLARVLVVLNELPRRNEAIRAVLDRMDAFRFEPSKAEIIAQMRTLWPEDGELIDLIAETATTPTLRTMVKALAWQKSPHLDVTEELVSECGVPAPIECLSHVMRTEPEAVWFERYRQATGLSERSFRRHKRVAMALIAASNGRKPIHEGTSAGSVQSRPDGTGSEPANGGQDPPPNPGCRPPDAEPEALEGG